MKKGEKRALLADVLEVDVDDGAGVGKQGVLIALQGAFSVFEKEFPYAENIAAERFGFFKQSLNFTAELFLRGGKHGIGRVAAVRDFVQGQRGRVV